MVYDIIFASNMMKLCKKLNEDGASYIAHEVNHSANPEKRIRCLVMAGTASHPEVNGEKERAEKKAQEEKEAAEKMKAEEAKKIEEESEQILSEMRDEADRREANEVDLNEDPADVDFSLTPQTEEEVAEEAPAKEEKKGKKGKKGKK